jgi:hypothetical protein
VSPDATFPCPQCGAELPVAARSCSECGSDAGTGWSETAEDDATELPEAMGDDEYGEFLARELPGSEPRPVRRRRLAWMWFALTLAFLFLLWTSRSV